MSDSDRNPADVRRRLGARFLSRAPEREVEDELAFHIEQRTRDFVERGMSPEAARRAALERFGDVQGVRRECADLRTEEVRAAGRRDWLDDLRQDLRFGLRSALRAPLFSLLAVVTLALGIGANAAVFGVVKSVLLDALPYADADGLVRVYGRFRDSGQQGHGPLSAGTIHDVVERQRSFASLGAFASLPRDAVFAGADEPRVVKVWWAEPQLFRTLGVRPVLGRPLRDEDAAGDTAFNVMLGYAAWQKLFGGDPKVLGQPVRINGITRTVVGVLPRGFVAPEGAADFYFPLGIAPLLRDPIGARGSHWLALVGRLKPGVTVDVARRDLAAISADLAREHPRDNANVTVAADPLRDAMVGETRTPLLVLMASAGLVLLITCANLAGALLSRTISRRKEFAVRVALGAGRGRLVRQLLTESVVLALVGGAAGILLASAGLAVLRGLASQAIPSYAQLSLDRGAVLVTALVALLTGLAFGVAPALSVGRVHPQGTLRNAGAHGVGGRGTSESRRSRQLRGALVAGQIALCVSLLAGAGLLARSLWALTVTPLGFRPDGVLTVSVQLPTSGYRAPEAIVRFYERLEERLRALPGVTAVGDVSELPTAVMNRNGIRVVGSSLSPDDQPPFVLYATVNDDYFRTLGVPLRGGRAFDARDRAPATHDDSASPPIIVSEAMAKRFWPKGDAVGAQLRMGPNPNSTPFTVVGVVGDVRNDPARRDAEPMAYGSARWDTRPSRTLLVRTTGDPMALVAPLRRELAALDPGVPLRDVATLPDFLGDRLSGRRLPVVLMTAFGALALLLASVGVYAMFSAMAAAREQEFGVRVALGASTGGIARLVLQQGAVWMALGLAGGAAGVVIVARAIGGLLYGVSKFDPVALGAAVVLLLLCGTVALLAPVRRATRVDPISVLR